MSPTHSPVMLWGQITNVPQSYMIICLRREHEAEQADVDTRHVLDKHIGVARNWHKWRRQVAVTDLRPSSMTWTTAAILFRILSLYSCYWFRWEMPTLLLYINKKTGVPVFQCSNIPDNPREWRKSHLNIDHLLLPLASYYWIIFSIYYEPMCFPSKSSSLLPTIITAKDTSSHCGWSDFHLLLR